ncbi:hypothetical protein [Schaalia canis]|uniref:Uncharacterized protein n=1 Tax=Schaalia canis TaxID=100469 RepID=A0A3P1SEX0_9ACTO|nr:hypothetical protein [Schaalia canis]RRC95698.1 hypothetical protein EII11_05420 [Schaalia canis]
MDIMQSFHEFESQLHSFVQQLKERGVPSQEYKDDSGTSINGWSVEYEDFPSYEDVMPGRNPYYMGGHWGHRITFLGEDGHLWCHEFRGSDTFNSALNCIETSTSNIVEKCPLGSMVGSEKPFKKILEKVQSAVLRAILE